jgi:hypothetical protein
MLFLWKNFWVGWSLGPPHHPIYIAQLSLIISLIY